MNAPEVSIILPTQGVRSSLAAALRSALAQAGVSLEVVVVDDAPPGSEWRGGHLLTTLLADPRVRVVPFQQARGCAAAKNAGLRAARGAWVCYLDDDNEYEPGKVRAQRELAVTTGSPVVLCGMQIRVAGRRRYRQIGVAAFAGDALLLDALADTNTLFHQRETGVWWDETLGTVDDACFFQALTTRADLSSVPNVPAPLVIYHAHPGARANRDFERFYRGQRCLWARWSQRYSAPARRILLRRSLVAFTKYRAGHWCEWATLGVALVRAGGWREWRLVANAAGVKLPLIRRWLVT